MDEDRIIDYLALLTDADLAALLAKAGARRSSVSRILDRLDEINAALGRIDEQIAVAQAAGDHVTTIGLKRQGQPLRDERAQRQGELSARLAKGRN